MTEIDLFALAHSGDIDARNELVRIHAGLVHFVARRLARTLADEAELDDLVSAGNFGLLQAVESFDPDRGLAFSTFATLRVRGAMLDELRRADRVSRGTRTKARHLQRVRNTLGNRFGRRATQREIADEAGVDLPTLWQWENEVVHGAECSLEAPLGDDGSGARVFGDSIPSLFPDVEIEFDRERESEFVREALDELGKTERQVLSMYFFDGMSLLEIAPHVGVTESGVSRIRTRALRQLRVRLERRGYQTAFAA
jgi:RNA polymerase sigma factor for flagellar operon FliA